MKNIKYKSLFLLTILFGFNMNAVTSLFESKNMTYEPYDYKKSEFNTLSVSKRIDCMMKKLTEFKKTVVAKKFNLNRVSYHELVKAIHAAHAVEHRLKLRSDQKAKLQRLDVGHSKQQRLKIRLENLQALLKNFKGKKFETKAQNASLYQVYKHLEKGLYAIDKKGYKCLINTESTPIFYE
jgi:hypothetical protein